MTDNEIVKALKCCSKAETRNECEQLKCPACKDLGCFFSTDVYNEDFIEVQKGLCSRVIDLIKRKDEMLSAQASKIFLYEDVLKEKTAEIDELRADNNYLFETMPRMKSEAIKELAEKILHEIVNRPSKIQSTSKEYLHGSAYRQNEIIDILKEMTEQKNDFKE